MWVLHVDFISHQENNNNSNNKTKSEFGIALADTLATSQTQGKMGRSREHIFLLLLKGGSKGIP